MYSAAAPVYEMVPVGGSTTSTTTISSKYGRKTLRGEGQPLEDGAEVGEELEQQRRRHRQHQKHQQESRRRSPRAGRWRGGASAAVSEASRIHHGTRETKIFIGGTGSKRELGRYQVLDDNENDDEEVGQDERQAPVNTCTDGKVDDGSVPDACGSPTDDCVGGGSGGNSGSGNGGDKEEDLRVLEPRSLLSTPNVKTILLMVAIVQVFGSVARVPACSDRSPGEGNERPSFCVGHCPSHLIHFVIPATTRHVRWYRLDLTKRTLSGPSAPPTLGVWAGAQSRLER